jgi:class 3 adenylate cyclase
LERDHLPHDVLFVFTRYAESACRAVHDAGGTVSYVGQDNICVIFGLHDSLSRACRQALAAAWHIGRALNDLNDGLDERWGCHANIVVSIHAGFAALSYIGQGVETVIAAGPAMQTVEALGAQARQANKAFAISKTVFDLAEYSHPLKDAQWTRGCATGRVTAKTQDGPLRPRPHMCYETSKNGQFRNM